MFKTLKHTLLKIIDVTALGFLAPYVRLAYGELPSPSVVAQAAMDLHVFATREDAKTAAYLAEGAERERWLSEAQAELAQAASVVASADTALAQARASEVSAKDARLAKLRGELSAMKAAQDNTKAKTQAELQAFATSLQAGDEAGRARLVRDITQADLQAEVARAELAAIEEKIKWINDEKDPAVVAAVAKQAAAAEHKQYVEKLIELLSTQNREVRSARGEQALHDASAGLNGAEGPAAFASARKVVSAEKQLEKTRASAYAQAPTLYYQIRRSILCVFLGFLLGSAVAIPIGVLCGLSRVFMAAMTPFIAILKPVSPIVWLPIALIIASALIPDPDQHWFTQWLWNVPLIGEYKINPAFLAAAATVALCSLWATMVNTALGVASVDKDHLNVARVLRLGFWSRLFKIVLPSALPLMFAGLRISLGVGWMVLIAAELLSTSEGIGKFVWDQFQNGASDSFAKMFVVVFVVGIIGLILDRIMVVFQRLVSFEGSIATV